MSATEGPAWAQSLLRTERVAGSIRVTITRRARGGVQRSQPAILGLGDGLVVGRPDVRLGGGGEFLAWPGDASDRTLPRQAVRVELLLDHVRFTLADSFRGIGGRPASIEAELDGRVLTREDFARPALDVEVAALHDRSSLVVRRTTGAGERETVTFEVDVQYVLQAGTRTVPAASGAAREAAAALRERWWTRVGALQVGATFRAAAAIVEAGAPRTGAELLMRMGRPDGTRPDRIIASAVSSLFDANRADESIRWDSYLRALDVAHLYADGDVGPETDGARQYVRFGDPEAFFDLAARLVRAGVVTRG